MSFFDIAQDQEKDIDINVLISANEEISCLLLENKVYFSKGKFDRDIDAYCNEYEYIGFFQISAKLTQS